MNRQESADTYRINTKVNLYAQKQAVPDTPKTNKKIIEESSGLFERQVAYTK